MAFLAALMQNIVNHLYAKNGTTPKMVSPIDFIPKWGEKEHSDIQKQSVEEMKTMMQGIVKHFEKTNAKKEASLKTKPVKLQEKTEKKK